jgi:hypothetical protein
MGQGMQGSAGTIARGIMSNAEAELSKVPDSH